MRKIKNVSFTAIGAGALVAASAVFVPGTAEAHCGEHQGTCAGYGDSTVGGGYCSGWDHWVTVNYYAGYCVRSSPPGVNSPCASDCGDGSQTCCDWGSTHGCYLFSQDEDWGNDGTCNP